MTDTPPIPPFSGVTMARAWLNTYDKRASELNAMSEEALATRIHDTSNIFTITDPAEWTKNDCIKRLLDAEFDPRHRDQAQDLIAGAELPPSPPEPREELNRKRQAAADASNQIALAHRDAHQAHIAVTSLRTSDISIGNREASDALRLLEDAQRMLRAAMRVIDVHKLQIELTIAKADR